MAIYPDSVRARARELWLGGGLTDEAIAAELGVGRVDTIRDWRRDGEWSVLKRAVEAATAVRVETERNAAKARIDLRHDQIAEALEALVIRCMKTGNSPRAGELRALAGAATLAQRMRRTANKMDAKVAAEKPDAETRIKRVVFSIAPRPE